MIACGEYPTLIDLETVFTADRYASPGRSAAQLAESAVRDSVLRSCLLPNRIRLDPELDPVDVSGLGGPVGQIAPILAPLWHGVGTDQMHLVREAVALPAADNRPVPSSASFSPLDFESDMEAGFREAYEVMRGGREPLAELLRACADAPIRCVLRPTFTYGSILSESYHPYHLGDALDRDRLFDQLWAGALAEPGLQRAYRAEKRDLWQGDIPYFGTRPGSHSLWTSSGEEKPEFFERSGLDDALQRLERLGPTDRSRQIAFLRTALRSSTDVRSQATSTARFPVHSGGSPMASALAIGAHLAREAFRSDGTAAWISLLEDADGAYVHTVTGADLYAGVPGVALFLAYLGEFADQQEYVDLAAAALRGLASTVDVETAARSSCGAFDGIGGSIYVLTHLGALLGAGQARSIIARQVERAEALARPDLPADVIGGPLVAPWPCWPITARPSGTRAR